MTDFFIRERWCSDFGKLIKNFREGKSIPETTNLTNCAGSVRIVFSSKPTTARKVEKSSSSCVYTDVEGIEEVDPQQGFCDVRQKKRMHEVFPRTEGESEVAATEDGNGRTIGRLEGFSRAPFPILWGSREYREFGAGVNKKLPAVSAVLNVVAFLFGELIHGGELADRS